MPKWRITSQSGHRWQKENGWISIAGLATVYSDEEKAVMTLPAGGLWEQLKSMEKPVCTECGSDDIKTDAYAVWDVVKQDWVLDQAFEKPCVCEKCSGECSIEWVEV